MAEEEHTHKPETIIEENSETQSAFVEKLVQLSGVDRKRVSSIIKSIYHERNELLRRVQDASTNQELEDIIRKQEHKLEGDIYWIADVLKTAQKLEKARLEVSNLESRLANTLMLQNERLLRHSLAYAEQFTLTKDPHYQYNRDIDLEIKQRMKNRNRSEREIDAILGELRKRSYSTSRIVGYMLRFKVFRTLRKARRGIIYVFLSFVIGAIAVSIATDIVSPLFTGASAILLIFIMWAINEIYSRYVSRIIFKRQRADLRKSVAEFYSAKFIASIELNVLTHIRVAGISEKKDSSQNSQSSSL